MLSVILFGIGTAHAVIGVQDDTPGSDQVVPFICEVNGTLDTQWAIAETVGSGVGSIPFDQTIGHVDAFIFNSWSQFIKDEAVVFTPFDVYSDGCKVLVTRLTNDQKTLLQTTVNANGVTKTVYAGYVLYVNQIVLDQFISWVYLNDIPNGFNAGFNGVSLEGGTDLGPLSDITVSPSELTEGPGTAVLADFLMPRYFFFNTNAGTFNWWMVLKGGAPDVNNTTQLTPLNHQFLNCNEICNEEEECRSVRIYTPRNLNFIDVQQVIPPDIFHNTIVEDHTLSLTETSMMGGGWAKCHPQTDQNSNFLNPADNVAVSVFGWSYQRAATGAVVSNWDVVHPMHRCGGVTSTCAAPIQPAP